VVVLDSDSVVSLYGSHWNLKCFCGVELNKGKLLFEHVNAEFGVVEEGLVA
jgi:hypothetical protein